MITTPCVAWFSKPFYTRFHELINGQLLSVGGNDALQQTQLLFTPAASTEEAVGLLADLAEQFEHDYRAAIAACLRPGLPLTICTIYNSNFPDPAYQRLVKTALALFSVGGEKIARAIAALATGTSRTDGATRIVAS